MSTKKNNHGLPVEIYHMVKIHFSRDFLPIAALSDHRHCQAKRTSICQAGSNDGGARAGRALQKKVAERYFFFGISIVYGRYM